MTDSFFTSDAIRLAVTQSIIAALLDPVTTVRSLASGVGDLSRTKKLKSKLDAVNANFEQLKEEHRELHKDVEHGEKDRKELKDKLQAAEKENRHTGLWRVSL